MSELLTARELADLLRVSMDTVRVKARRNEIPGAVKPFGALGAWRFDRVKVAAWLETNAVEDTWAAPALARTRRRAS